MAIGTGAAILGASGIGGLLGFASSITGGGLSYYKQSKLQDRAAKLNYDYSIKAAQNMAHATRQGYEKAGYNPMLAVQNGVSGANASFSGTGSGPSYDLAGGISSGIANAQSFQRLINETKQSDSVVDLNDSTSRKNLVEASEIMERMPFVGAQAKANIQKTQAETVQLNALAENYEARLELDRMLGLMGIDTTRRGQDISYNATTYGRDIELAKQKRYNEWAEKHPWLSSMSETAERHPALLQYGRDYLNYKRESKDYKKNRRRR